MLLQFCLFGHELQSLSITGKYAIDNYSTWKLEDFKQHRKKEFSLKEDIVIGYNENKAVWCELKITNSYSNRKKILLSLPNIHLDSITLFNNGKEYILGDRTNQISAYSSAHTFQIQLKKNEVKTIYLRVKKTISYFNFSVEIAHEETLEKTNNRNIFFISFFIGIVVILCIFNLILFTTTRNRIYFKYIIYSILTGIYILITTGVAKNLLFPEFIYFSELRIYTSSLWFIAMSYFLVDFLNMRINHPRTFKMIQIINISVLFIVSSTILLLVQNSTRYLHIFSMIGYVFFLLAIIFTFSSVFKHFKINKPNATYVLLAFAPHFTWAISIIFKAFGILDKDLKTDWIIWISIYEVFFFGFILGRNYVQTFRNHNRLIQEIVLEKEKSLQAISQAEINQRKQVANIIHDNFGSKLAHISHLLESNQMENVKKNMTELTNEIRDISHRIMPKSLDEGALKSSIQSQINIINKGNLNCNISFFEFDFPDKIKAKWVHNMYLISLEIINNALRHGNPTEINIEFYAYDEVYVFQFADNGQGFDVAKTKKGFGLTSIINRVEAARGTFEINSNSTNGTTIQIILPKMD